MMAARNTRVIYTADESPEYYTPAHFRELAWSVLGPSPITLDPCTGARNVLRARIAWGIEHGMSEALELRPWAAQLKRVAYPTVWCNPPYGRGIGAWTAELQALAAARSDARILALLPCRPGAGWYAQLRSTRLVELHGRLRFETPDGAPMEHPARWGSALAYWGPVTPRIARLLRSVGRVRPNGVRPIRRQPDPDPRQLSLLGPDS